MGACAATDWYSTFKSFSAALFSSNEGETDGEGGEEDTTEACVFLLDREELFTSFVFVDVFRFFFSLPGFAFPADSFFFELELLPLRGLEALLV